MRGPYRWDPRTARYHDASGRIVARTRLVLDQALNNAQKRMLDSAERLRAGKLSLRGFRDEMQRTLSETHLYSAAAARGGWKQMRQADYGRVGGELKSQYRYLNRMVKQIGAGEQKLDGSFIRRVKLYAQSGRKTYHKTERGVQQDLGMDEERNVLHRDAEHCDGCEVETRRLWVPIGELVPIGERDCLANDKCEIQYRRRPRRERKDDIRQWGEGDFPPANTSGVDSLERFTRPDGTLTPERQRLHDAILEDTLRGQAPIGPRPIVNVLGGGPAAGKSSVTDFLEAEMPDRGVTLDVDKIRTKFPEYGPMLKRGDTKAAAWNHEEASALTKRITDEAVKRRLNFIADGTGNSGFEKLAGKVSKYRASGARIVARYVTVDVDEAMRRMIKRGKRTGRYVPEDYLRDVHRDVSRVFREGVERGIFDEFELWDTSTEPARRVVTGGGTAITVHDEAAWQRFLAKGDVPIASKPRKPTATKPAKRRRR